MDSLGNVGAATSSTVFVDRTPPTVRLKLRTLRPLASGATRVRLECPATEPSGPCTGSVQLRSVAKLPVGSRARIVMFGSARLSIRVVRREP